MRGYVQFNKYTHTHKNTLTKTHSQKHTHTHTLFSGIHTRARKSARNRTRVVDQTRCGKWGETWVEGEKNVDKKVLVQ